MEITKFEDVVELNVGGKLVTTLLSTLTMEPDSMLAVMFSGRHVLSKDKDGRYFMDCDGDVFRHILDFLRFGTLPPPGISLDVYKLARYLQIDSLVEQLQVFHPVKFQNQIAEIRKQVDNKEYKELKLKAINEIEKLNVGPQEDKALHFFCMSSTNILSCLSSRDSFETFDFPACTNISIDIDCTRSPYLTDGMRALLAHELCELGFAKYTVTKKEYKYCNRCSMELEHQQIMLFTH